MYVKILDDAHSRSAVLYTSDPAQPLHFGKKRLDADPSEVSAAVMMELLEVGADSFDLTNVTSAYTGVTDRGQTGEPFWDVNWVRFHKTGDDMVHLVASTGPIYVLDESGKTIDRV